MTNSKRRTRSEQLFERAKNVMPGGNTRDSVYRFPHPYYVAYGKGCRITDVDGVERIDFVNNYTSLIHGHAHPAIVEAVSKQLPLGTAMAMPTEAEVELAELLCSRIPSVQHIRFVNSGSEAVMMALKAARAFTGRPKIAKVEGAYHGSYDFAEISQTATPERWGAEAPESLPVALGTPPGVLADVVVIPFNDVAWAHRILDTHADELACVMIDPMPHRVGMLPVSREFLDMLSVWTRDHGALLVFDEVISLRLGYEGAQGGLDAIPDLTAMGKIVGGGFPVGAIGGRLDVMAVFDPTRQDVPVPHGGTFNANPVTMRAGEAAMRLMTRDRFDHINRLGAKARRQLAEAISVAEVPGQVTGAGSLFLIHLTQRKLSDYRSAYRSPAEAGRIDRLVEAMLQQGVMLAMTTMGAISTPMDDAEIDVLSEKFLVCLREMKREGLFDTRPAAQ